MLPRNTGYLQYSQQMRRSQLPRYGKKKGKFSAEQGPLCRRAGDTEGRNELLDLNPGSAMSYLNDLWAAGSLVMVQAVP